MFVSDQGMVFPGTVCFTMEGFWVSYNPKTPCCSPSSQIWPGRLLRCLTWTQENNLQLAENFSQNIFNIMLQITGSLRYTRYCPLFPSSMAGEGWLFY